MSALFEAFTRQEAVLLSLTHFSHLSLDLFPHMAMERENQIAERARKGCTFDQVYEWILCFASANGAGKRQLFICHLGTSGRCHSSSRPRELPRYAGNRRMALVRRRYRRPKRSAARSIPYGLPGSFVPHRRSSLFLQRIQRDHRFESYPDPPLPQKRWGS